MTPDHDVLTRLLDRVRADIITDGTPTDRPDIISEIPITEAQAKVTANEAAVATRMIERGDNADWCIRVFRAYLTVNKRALVTDDATGIVDPLVTLAGLALGWATAIEQREDGPREA